MPAYKKLTEPVLERLRRVLGEALVFGEAVKEDFSHDEMPIYEMCIRDRALAAKERGDKHHVFTLLGDGECNEGAVWEGAMLAAHYKLGNLVALIDRNMVSLSSPTEEFYGGLKLEPLGKKFEAFGWNVMEINGNCMEEVLSLIHI